MFQNIKTQNVESLISKLFYILCCKKKVYQASDCFTSHLDYEHVDFI